MKIYDFILTFLKLKKPNTPKRDNWIEYADFAGESFLNPFSDSNLLLIALTLISFKFTYVFMLVIFILYYRFLSTFGDAIDSFADRDFEAQQLVHMIQSNHMQSLKEKFIINPNLVDSTYRRKSLLYWAKHYNNLVAHKMIIELLKVRSSKKS